MPLEPVDAHHGVPCWVGSASDPTCSANPTSELPTKTDRIASNRAKKQTRPHISHTVDYQRVETRTKRKIEREKVFVDVADRK